ncbi:MAG: hypothetical protein D6714_19495, partial [Bacteroidetes bacterium]
TEKRAKTNRPASHFSTTTRSKNEDLASKNTPEKSNTDTPVFHPKQPEPPARERAETSEYAGFSALPGLKMAPFVRAAATPEMASVSLPENGRWQVGWSVSAFVFGDSPASPMLKTGPRVIYDLPGRWAIGVEGLYFLDKTDHAPAGESAQTSFGFGGDYDAYQIIPTSAHWLELPVFVQFKTGRHVFGAGVSASGLMGLRGDLVFQNHKAAWERTDEENAEFARESAQALAVYQSTGTLNEVRFTTSEKVTSGWFRDSDIRRLQWSVFGGYGVRLTPAFSVEIRAQYRLSDYYKTTAKRAAEKSPWGVGISANWRFK